MEALNFKLSKSHKKVLKQVNKFLIQGIRKGETVKSSRGKPDREVRGTRGTIKDSRSESTPDPASKLHPRPGQGADPTKPAMRKAKDIRLERKKLRELRKLRSMAEDESTSSKGSTGSLERERSTMSTTSNCSTKTFAEFISEPDKAEKCAHKLEVRLIIPSLQDEEFRKSERESAEVFKQYRMGIHKDQPHECDRDHWLKLLVHSPLKTVTKNGGPPMGYGSLHQHYILDGRIIAVGVLDILPQSLSAVYLYYLPEYRFLSIGTYTALREIAFIQELNKKAPDFMYYYLGYYVHSCPKLTYKSRYSPSFLLCPETYTWIPIADCLPKLIVSEYSRLADEEVEDSDVLQEIGSIPVLFCGQTMTYGFYKTLNAKALSDIDVKRYALLVGRKCAMRLLLLTKIHRYRRI
ncbi:Arginyl-tRNA--protein transferase 1 [Mizuhopecten yessoensis]|uniref:Arginyl-tRNA--protein transferase 1 n=2 Tax=Mizuhopecten yessoensis TaxID=6573 RepID=A0A210QCB6_MIZYE|nr:Arginyl-tRNA--protein transferase 1 [Mizuhopecten yessoensis]